MGEPVVTDWVSSLEAVRRATGDSPTMRFALYAAEHGWLLVVFAARGEDGLTGLAVAPLEHMDLAKLVVGAYLLGAGLLEGVRSGEAEAGGCRVAYTEAPLGHRCLERLVAHASVCGRRFHAVLAYRVRPGCKPQPLVMHV